MKKTFVTSEVRFWEMKMSELEAYLGGKLTRCERDYETGLFTFQYETEGD